jgi:inner membrane protein involved in colicin E2 resistance
MEGLAMTSREGDAMNPLRLIAIGFIYCCVTVAWMVLGGSVLQRTGESDHRLAQEVSQLWGGKHDQRAPTVTLSRPRIVTTYREEKDATGKTVRRRYTTTEYDSVPLPLDRSQVGVDMDLDQRRKGLLWYNTYAVGLVGRYTIHNPDDDRRAVQVHLDFPSMEAIYDGFTFRVNGEEGESTGDFSRGVTVAVWLPAHGEGTIDVGYRSRGLGAWTYSFGPGVAQVRDFALDMKTNFTNVDFPAGTISPSKKERQGTGYALHWSFESLITGQKVGMDPPNRLNPGPLASRITFFAPVSLLFFMIVMVILGALRGRSLHPMNYFFLAAAFFSFHLLLAYLADQINIHAAFAIASATSVFLVVTYLRLVAGFRVALVEAGFAQLVFLVLFSYAFFFEGLTGLTVTIGSVITLFVLMQITGRVDWTEVLAKGRSVGDRAPAPVR